jgi:23S rRNA (guanosine2251-2'-O)-methyltransferase
MLKLNAKQLRKKNSVRRKIARKLVKKQDIYIILDNVLDTYNIGSVFRLADAIAAKKLYLCGGSETPPNPRIKKASINTTEVVKWEYFDKTEDAIKALKKKVSGIQIVGIEQTAKSILYDSFEYRLPVALIVGHESDGISKEILNLCDAVVELPMFGVNVSLNVMVSLGIVLYHLISAS